MAPAELETIIFTHPGIQNVCVVGIPDEQAGEVPMAFIILKEGATITQQQIVQLVDSKYMNDI